MILVAESLRFSEEAARILRGAGELRLADLDRPALLAAVADAEVLWVRLRHRVDREVLRAAPRLRWIATPTTGLNHLDLEEAARREIGVISLKGETEFLRGVAATAEHTMALILSLLRNLPAAFDHVRQGGWNRDLFRGSDLCGKTAGIVGYGRIGRKVAQYLTAFGVRVLATDPYVDTVAAKVTPVSMNTLLENSDIVSLHVDLSKSTEKMFGASEFARMKAGAWLINTSRGELVDESALLGALEAGRLAGAALDVLCNENAAGMSDNALVDYARSHQNLIVTPHLGGCTAESMEKTEIFLAQRVAAALKAREFVCAG